VTLAWTTVGESIAVTVNSVVLVTRDQVVAGASELFGLAVLAGTLSALVALTYRWYTRERAPLGLALLFGLAGVAVYLNTTTVLGQVISGEMDPMDAALFNIVAFLFGVAGAATGHRTGDHFGKEVLLGDPGRDINEEVNRLVETVGRVTSVQLPEEIDDVVGYDPVSPRTKTKLAGKRFVFPRNLTVEQLRERLISRLKTDYAVGTVDMELADDGTVEYLAVGSRAAGIGPTLPPATNAVAIQADPAFAASAGDLVQVWETDPMRRILTAELRGVAGDVVTIAISSADTPKIDPTRQYRLVTLPVDDRPEREFASLLRAADETFSSVTIEAGSPLHGMPVGALNLTIVSVKPEDEEPTALPEATYVLAPGDVVFAIALPEALRKLETASEPLDPALVPDDEADIQQETQVDAQQTPPAQADSPESPAASESPATDSDTAVGETGDDGVGGKADSSTFDDLKAEYESGDGWEDEEEPEDDGEPVEAVATSGDEPDTDDEFDSGGASSFDDLKAEYESGDADWADDGSGGDDDEEIAFDSDDEGLDEDAGRDVDTGAGDDTGDDLVSLENADVSFSDDESETEDEGSEEEKLSGLELEDDEDEDEDLLGDDGLFEENDDDDLSGLDLEDDGDEDLSGLGLDDDDDDLSALDLEDGSEDDDPFGDDEDGPFDDEDSDGNEDDDGEDDEEDEDDDGGGGGTSFQQLKEEFESGDADWEDDISDSPGGDMRLDE